MHTNSMYNDAIRLTDNAKDAATRELLESIVKEEDGHVDWLEEQLDQIAQIGAPLYLSANPRVIVSQMSGRNLSAHAGPALGGD